MQFLKHCTYELKTYLYEVHYHTNYIKRRIALELNLNKKKFSNMYSSATPQICIRN